MLDSIKRNNLREYPAPEDKFDIWYGGVLKLCKFDYFQMITEDCLNSDTMYSSQEYYKSFKTEQLFGVEIKVDGDLVRDKNAIYFANNVESTKAYCSYVYKVEPLGKIYRYHNTFYSSGVKIMHSYRCR